MVSKFKLGSITGALLASTLYSSATANADTTTTQTAATTAVQTPSTDTEAGNTGSLTITTEADSAKDSQQQVSATDTTSQEASHVADSADSSDSKAQADTLSASAITANSADDNQTASQSTNGNDKSDKQADSDNSNADLTASSVTDSSSTITVNIADLLEGSSAQTSNAGSSTASDNQIHTVTLQYYDIINDKVVAEKVIQGEKSSITNLDFPLPEGYTYAVDSSDLQMPSKWEFGTRDVTTYQVPIYRKEDLTRTITRTINVHKPTGMETIKQPVVYVSKVSSVEFATLSRDFMMVPFSLPLQDKTKRFITWPILSSISANEHYYDVTVSAAQPDGTTDWAEFDAPEIEGYTVSQAVVSKVAVAPTDSDVTVDIYYTPKQTEPEPETPTTPQPEEPTTPATPQPEEPKVDQPKPETPTVEEPVAPKAEEQPAVVESIPEPVVTPSASVVPAQPVQPVAVNTTNAEPTQLPQTGNAQNHTTGLIGTVSAMTGSMLAFAGSKKKRQD
ncbi:mucin-binding protein [Limosilactobacillus mucosae]|uniref:LPXTG cell wall anchor domain-containing protein n=1 Tax=Limosilactobacillus mucosae TaxID=97478 RepID=A0AAJ1HPR2_LIMMU|nr:LPXTG cell wall anchor domain-containing protein [Limosilactobacillus mucosae]MDC2828428.1 LPXTG cell wall anchor domain-containing protein [Limosilactobacillus mucosae]MDC2834326.1 LPXTG cell wall anchor domain-containing protein [Limosilactobacillus mucosae]